MCLIYRSFYRVLFVWLTVVGLSFAFVVWAEPGTAIAQPVMEVETDHSVGFLISQLQPFHQQGSHAVVVENIVVAAPDFKYYKIKLSDKGLLRNSLHGRLCFTHITGVSIELRNTCYRFLNESWLQYNCFRC